MYLTEVKGNGGIQAKVVADSLNNGDRLTTLELTYPRFIHGQFMTHRVFSRNASSSRAMPVNKVIDQVECLTAMPIHWGVNKPGMQAEEELKGTSKESAIAYWESAAEISADIAKNMVSLGLHKQVANRILEPYQFIKVVVTATEWDNFFNLRLHNHAQPEIYELALVMQEAIDGSVPIPLDTQGGRWVHAPYILGHGIGVCPIGRVDLIKASVARCARVSYMNHDNTSPDIEKDIELHDKLLAAGHMSPFEHVAWAMKERTWDDDRVLEAPWEAGLTHQDRWGNYWSGNFKGFIQYRQYIEEGGNL